MLLVKTFYANFDPFREGVSDFDLVRAFAREYGRDIGYVHEIVDDRALRLIIDREKLDLTFEVWGDPADLSNPDEKANFDGDIDEEVYRRFGTPLYTHHNFESNGFNDFFVHQYRYKATYNFGGLLKANVPVSAIESLARATAKKALAES